MSAPSSPRAGAPMGVAQPYDPRQGTEDDGGVPTPPLRSAETRQDASEHEGESPVYLSTTSRPCTFYLASPQLSRSASPSPSGDGCQPVDGQAGGKPRDTCTLASQVAVDVPLATSGEDTSEGKTLQWCQKFRCGLRRCGDGSPPGA